MRISFIRKGMMRMRSISLSNDKRIKGTSLPLYISVIIAGIIIGAAIQNTTFFDNIQIKINCLFMEKCSVIAEVRTTFICLLFFVAAAFLAGSSAIGQLLAYFLLLFSGIYTGYITASVYQIYGKSAFITILTTVIPRSAALITVVILSVREALRSSFYLFEFYLHGDVRENRRITLKLYCVRFLVIILLSLFFSAVAGALFYLRIRAFRL